tara:strand:- start:61 stop:177 length:117 start_codon:yes stop_codon:yes gene_type:complete
MFPSIFLHKEMIEYLIRVIPYFYEMAKRKIKIEIEISG